MDIHQIFYASFWIIFVIAFFVDFKFTGTNHKTLSVKSALAWTLFWIVIAFIYNGFIYAYYPDNDTTHGHTGQIMALKFLSGFLMEKSLSVDNLFVFILIFSSMGIKEDNQAKLLKLGILISIVLRIVFILAGMSLVNQFEWLFYVFGAILVFTAIKMIVKKEEEEEVHPEKNAMYRWASKLFPIDTTTENFFSRKNGKFHVSYFFLVLLVIASTDVLFAVDSIPAIIGIIREGAKGTLTIEQENFIAISSNMFAVMGLSSLFFALKGVMNSFHYLKIAVAFILLFIGFKMLIADIPFFSEFMEQHHYLSFFVILGSMVVAVIASLIRSHRLKKEAGAELF